MGGEGEEEEVRRERGMRQRRNKEGIESVEGREMKGCVGVRGVGVEQRRKKGMVTSPVYPLAPQCS